MDPKLDSQASEPLPGSLAGALGWLGQGPEIQKIQKIQKSKTPKLIQFRSRGPNIEQFRSRRPNWTPNWTKPLKAYNLGPGGQILNSLSPGGQIGH